MVRLLLCVIILFTSIPADAFAAEKNLTDEQIYAKRQEMYNRMQSVTQIPWQYFAAVDQYERNVRRVRRDIPKATGVIGIYYKPEIWAGPLNPNPKDTNPSSIQFFSGVGLDGNGDGVADSTNDEDVLYTFATYLRTYGTDKENLKIALWEYYQRDKTVGLIMGHLKLYSAYDTLKLDTHAFPLPIRSNFSYRNTWGDARGWGGRRMHEGTDIFASYGVPVRSTCYGVIEIKGWNKFGGWRLGIRDINNTYHYFAHLNGFAKDLEVGQVVEPGQIIGSVGSSGYGPPGTAGKFPPHLHYGMYKDNGYSEWSFDPFPHLKSWERVDRRKR
ncbi:peptidase M23 [Bacillus sp. LL01]|nr:peptidase M23 [Bacillus sp. LL01]